MSPKTPAGDFDLYFLAQSWAATFCCKNEARCSTAVLLWASDHLALHGLWPAYDSKKDGTTFPSHCSTKHKYDAMSVPPLALDYAPNYHGGLAKHEWKSHGTCTALEPKRYFEESMRVMLSFPKMDRGTPKALVENVGGSVNTEALRKEYTNDVAIRVSKGCVLEEITSCWSKRNTDEGVKAGKQTDCPLYLLKGVRNNARKCKDINLPRVGQCEYVKAKMDE